MHMRKFLNNVVAIVITNAILIGFLVFQMSRTQVPITHSFESKAEKDGERYYIVISDDLQFNTDKPDTMFISANKNERVMNVRIEIQDQRIYFENDESIFADNYDQTFTYEIVTKQISLLECIFSRGGKTIE